MPFRLAWHSYTLSTPSPQLLPIWKGRNIRRMYRWLVGSSSSVGFYCMDSSRVPTHTKGNWRYVSWDLGKTSDSQLQLHWNELCHFPPTAPARPIIGPNASALGNIFYMWWRTETELLSHPGLPEHPPFAPFLRDWIQSIRLNSVYSLTNR